MLIVVPCGDERRSLRVRMVSYFLLLAVGARQRAVRIRRTPLPKTSTVARTPGTYRITLPLNLALSIFVSFGFLGFVRDH